LNTIIACINQGTWNKDLIFSQIKISIGEGTKLLCDEIKDFETTVAT
jgi:hypothetical protein